MLSKIGLLIFIVSCFGFNDNHDLGFFISALVGMVLFVYFNNREDKKKP